MEDYFDKLLYLVAAIIYVWLNREKRRETENKPQPDSTSEVQPAPTAYTNTNWADREKSQALEAQKVLHVRKPSTQTTTTLKLPSSEYNAAIVRPTIHCPPSKRIDYMLRRYNSWQKALIMKELIQPYF